MAIPERDTVYSAENPNRTVYTRESSATGWFVGIIVALALLAIGYLIFSANSGPAPTTVDVNNTPAITTTAPADTSTQPMTDTNTAPMTESAPAATTPAAPATDGATTPSTTAPATDTAPAATDTAPAQ